MSQIGLKDLHYAILTTDSKDVLTYGEVKPMVGAINATINPNISTQELYADDQLYDSTSTMGKVDVEVETAEMPLEVRAEVQGATIRDGVLIEKSTDIAPHIALAFKSQKTNGKNRFVWLLKGKAEPMAEDFTTKKENVEHKTPKLKLAFMPRMNDAEWKHTGDEDGVDFTGADSWFTAVPVTIPQV